MGGPLPKQVQQDSRGCWFTLPVAGMQGYQGRSPWLVCCLWLARWARPWPMFRWSVRPSTSARTWIELSLHAAISCDASASAHEIARPHTPIGVVLFCLSGSWMRRWQTAHELLKQIQSMMADTIYEETCISVRIDSSLQS